MLNGSIFAVRRRHRRPVPDDVIDDLHVSLSILCDGYRVVHAPDVRAYERALTTSSDEFNRKVRIACQAFNVHRLSVAAAPALGQVIAVQIRVSQAHALAISVYACLGHDLLCRWIDCGSAISSRIHLGDTRYNDLVSGAPLASRVHILSMGRFQRAGRYRGRCLAIVARREISDMDPGFTHPEITTPVPTAGTS